MNIEEKIRQIMRSKELSSAEKLDSLHALIPPDVCKIDNLSQATLAQLKRSKDGLAVTQAMQQIRRIGLKFHVRNQTPPDFSKYLLLMIWRVSSGKTFVEYVFNR